MSPIIEQRRLFNKDVRNRTKALMQFVYKMYAARACFSTVSFRCNTSLTSLRFAAAFVGVRNRKKAKNENKTFCRTCSSTFLFFYIYFHRVYMYKMKDKAKVENVYIAKNNDLLPTLITFQNGKLLALNKSRTRFWRLKRQFDSAESSQAGALLALNGQTYFGLINCKETNGLTDTYICVRKKAKNTLAIIPVDQASLSNNVIIQTGNVPSSQIEALHGDTLLKKFGGRKAMRYIADKEKMHVNVNIVQEGLQAQVDAETSTNNEENADNNITYYESIRPRFNSEAKEVSEVYKLTDIVPQELLDRLEEEAKTIYQTKVDEIP
uniref:Uncharacterized protein n=1 Tax=Glossina palpalis gambiensis TaxID=67801 RepID=A0A1B0C7K7_9MUSC